MNSTLSRGSVAQDLRRALQGALAPAQLDALCRLVSEASDEHPAYGQVTPCVCVRIAAPAGKTFRSEPGPCEFDGPPANGQVYTDDLDLLYRTTRNYQYTATPVYVSVVFFDDSGGVLGVFQGAAPSIISGIGGGVGSWS
ncbi:VapA/VapB family virulence-associated protein [Nannocystis sp. RBIL2]|uniref:VapA/VapB family virulence-associated protein n=1 Tax=Nannocystis sp. RBIL2 TaxID=2996788 RepID=UPI0022715859|nr:VapA/VapB family virulence-associated protein [Nannocystis sp. RBIL2]MCY1064669.1 VapA/VapB family virulence-associated protein [Nannocystis sp. RBIL2]